MMLLHRQTCLNHSGGRRKAATRLGHSLVVGPRRHLLSPPALPKFFSAPPAAATIQGRSIYTRSSCSSSITTLSPDALQRVDAAVVWFKHDLRIDDHPGLHACSQASPSLKHLTCLYVIDPEQLSGLLSIPAGPEVLVASLNHLRSKLRSIGSDLIVQTGCTKDILKHTLPALKAGALITEAEVQSNRAHYTELAIHAAAAAIATANPLQPALQTLQWHTTAWDTSSFDMNYRLWTAKKGSPSQPLPPPSKLPPPHSDLDAGHIPTPTQLRALLQAHSPNAAHASVTDIIESIRADASSSIEGRLLSLLASSSPDPRQLLSAYLTLPGPASPGSTGSSEPQTARLQQWLQDVSSRGLSPQHLVAEAAVALELPAAPGGTFKALLGPWMDLGTLSRRRLVQQATEQGASLLPQRTAAAMQAAETADFHCQLATVGAARGRPEDAGGMQVKQFIWRGMQNEFCVVEPSEATPDAPAILLVHGFGAFGDQWRDNMEPLAKAGFRVFAPTLPGFGRSEKAAVPYSQDLWRDFLRDFTLQVVGGPVVLAGNSIGGFISTSMAADYPQLVSGLILLNSAGPIDTSFTIEAWEVACTKKAPPPKFVVQAVSRALFWYLELTIKGTLKWLYPTNPGRADPWLAEEIYRAACDPGSLEVFQSVFYLPPPRALNYLVSNMFKGPTMVLQGALDPLNDARSRARDMGAACPQHVEVVLLEAGHCPHDEQPDKVNKEILSFIQRKVLLSQDADVAEMMLSPN